MWHAIVRVGGGDAFEPEVAAAEPRIEVGFARPDDRWSVSNNLLSVMQESVGATCEGVPLDLAHLAMAVYAADLRIPRRFANDRWSRDITVHFPVSDLRRWSSALQSILKGLNYLTGDRWQIVLRQREGEPEQPEGGESAPAVQVDSLCLFSGGLDSLAGAIDLLSQGNRVALVAHHGAGLAQSIQNQILAVLRERYEDACVSLQYFVQPPKHKLKDGEPSMRSRSFLFLGLAVASASALRSNAPVVIAENGLISLNVPLTPSRIGSSSTRTTHPYFIELYRKLLTKLGINVELQLPYRFKTKGEMLVEVEDQEVLKETAALSMSCSHPESGRFQGFTSNHHCGYCVPCVIRRAAMSRAGLDDAEYNIDVLVNRPDYKKEIGRDVRAFDMAVKRFDDTSYKDWISSVLSTGKLPEDDIREYVDVYKRGMEEVTQFLGVTN